MALFPCFLKRSSAFSFWLGTPDYVIAGSDPQLLSLIACLSLTESFNLCISVFSPLKWEWYLPSSVELMWNLKKYIHTHTVVLKIVGTLKYWWHCCCSYFITTTLPGVWVFRQIYFLSKRKKFNSLFSLGLSRLLREKLSNSFGP